MPIGTKERVLLPTDDFEATQRALQRAVLVSGDFTKVVELAGKGDLLFVDPPYTVQHNNNGFIKYNERLFSWADQLRLRDSIIRAKRRGAYIVLTNASTAAIRKLYSNGFSVREVMRSSVIAASSDKRGLQSELIIKSF